MFIDWCVYLCFENHCRVIYYPSKFNSSVYWAELIYGLLRGETLVLPVEFDRFTTNFRSLWWRLEVVYLLFLHYWSLVCLHHVVRFDSTLGRLEIYWRWSHFVKYWRLFADRSHILSTWIVYNLGAKRFRGRVDTGVPDVEVNMDEGCCSGSGETTEDERETPYAINI